mgnify:CR=1 FL=1
MCIRDRSDIVISINNHGEIIKTNEECEKVSGYSKYETLNKNFLDFLAPERYSKQWKKIFESIKKNKLINDFKLPLLTRNGHEIMISWSSFPVTNGQGNVGDISLVGRFVTAWNDAMESNIGQAKNVSLGLNENEDFFKIFKELERKNQELEKLNLELEKKLKKTKSKKTKKETEDKSILDLQKFSIGFKNKKKKEDVENLIKELDERKKILDQREAQLNEEKRTIDEKRNWFVKWREKLEALEFEIEDRQQDLLKKEKISSEPIIESKNEIDEIKGEPNVIDNINECAIVIQRGILKQANESFANLLRYNNDEIIEKSLFDFICPEGFPGLEEYYLGRLKGDDVSVYETVFLTKDNDKVFVEVNTKPTTYKNDKAEIAIIKKIEKKQK